MVLSDPDESSCMYQPKHAFVETQIKTNRSKINSHHFDVGVHEQQPNEIFKSFDGRFEFYVFMFFFSRST